MRCQEHAVLLRRGRGRYECWQCGQPMHACPRIPSDGKVLKTELTPRQVMIVGLAARGTPNAEIGRLLGISTRTVERHLLDAYRVLAVHSRTEAADALELRGQYGKAS